MRNCRLSLMLKLVMQPDWFGKIYSGCNPKQSQSPGERDAIDSQQI
jgi:hypothetical protein